MGQIPTFVERLQHVVFDEQPLSVAYPGSPHYGPNIAMERFIRDVSSLLTAYADSQQVIVAARGWNYGPDFSDDALSQAIVKYDAKYPPHPTDAR